ncbi:MAG: YggT family protein [Clostridiales bacterium]|nr:YggT family protein [Clostridiales bacterium]
MWTIIRAIDLLFEIMYYLIIARIILSWVIRNPYNKYYMILVQITEPVLAPFRNLIYRVGGGRYGIDFSPILAIFALSVIRNIIIRIISMLYIGI